MSHRTDRVSLTPLSPPATTPTVTPPPHREVRGRPLELVPVSGQVQNPLGIHIEPSWCFCHVTERRSDPSITSVEFTAGAADHITNGHQPGEPETEPRRLFWIICRIQESVRNFSSVKSSLLTFLFSSPECLCTVNVCLFCVTKTCFTKRDSSNWRPGTQTKQNRVKTVFVSEKSFTEKHTH